MSQLPGYAHQTVLHESGKVRILRAVRGRDGAQVVLKIFRPGKDIAFELQRRNAEFQLAERLNGLDGVVPMEAIEQSTDGVALVMKDTGGTSLREMMAHRTLSLEGKLSLARGLVRALGQVHQAGVIHNDISPGNVLVHAHSADVRLIDFENATAATHETRELSLPETMGGTPHYMSPEQTGRMNRSVDYRSDFYALGAVLYELFTGRTVFEASDVLELLHSHLARAPRPPKELNAELPGSLSGLILKLLEKHAEDRYQGCEGVDADLAELIRLRQEGKEEDFPLARFDLAADIDLPEKLYGRDTEIATVMEAYEQAAQGKRVLLLVGGASGAGKTRLINELHRPLTEKGGLFLSGKFEALKRDIPYHALTAAFGGLLQQLLTLPEEDLSPVRTVLQERLAPNAQVLCDLFPDLEVLLGKQPRPEELAPNDAQIRFELQFVQLVRGLIELRSQLVLFLDDMQWADGASLKLIEILLRSNELSRLLVIGSYRTTEVGSDHPLHELARTAGHLSRLEVSPLKYDQVLQMVCDSLRLQADTAAPLAAIVSERSAGNPLFVREFLREMRHGGAIERDPESKQWRIDYARVQGMKIPDNVVDLLLEKLQRLSGRTQKVLSAAACLGRDVEPRLLARTVVLTEEETLAAIAQCSSDGLLIRVREAGEGRAGHFRFVHDKVQEAATLLLQEAEMATLHANVGRLLLEVLTPAQREHRLFEIVNHLNRGATAASATIHGLELARLNLQAGRRAMASVAHSVAARYFDRGLELLPESAWNDDYELCLSLHQHGAETAALQSRYAQMEERAVALEQHARSVYDQVSVNEIRVQAMVAQNKPTEACDTGVRFMARLGVHIPERPKKIHAIVSLLSTRRTLKRTPSEKLKALPSMTDAQMKAAMRILGSMSFPAYLSSVNTLVVQASKQMQLSLAHGVVSESCYVIGGYGMLLLSLHEVKLVERLIDVALTLGSRPEGRAHIGRTRVLSGYFLQHRFRHYGDVGPELLQGYRECLEGGDYKYAAVAINCRAGWLFHATPDLNAALVQIGEGTEKLRSIGSDEHLISFQILHQQLGHNLTQTGLAKPWVLEGTYANADTILNRLKESDNRPGMANTYYCLVVASLIFDQPREALDLARAAQSIIFATKLTPLHGRAITVCTLALLSGWAYLSEAERKAVKKTANQALKTLDKFCEHAAMNYRHMALMIRSELARCEGRTEEACLGFDEAASVARQEAKDPLFEPLAYELAARAIRASGRKEVHGRGYVQNALNAWGRWGAWGKVEQLRKVFPDGMTLVAAPTPASPTVDPMHVSLHDSTRRTTDREAAEGLDLQTVMKASQAISREIELERLLGKMMDITMESAGADGAALLLLEGGELVLKSFREVGREASEGSHHADSVAQFVRRTQKPVVVDNAVSDERFRSDPHVKRAAPRSVLGLPIFQSGELLGVLYLENQKLARAFSPRRVELLTMLAAQAAISMTNARLYSQLEGALVEAQESSRLKSEFLANVSHELRTPLNAIINIPEALLRGIVNVRDGVCGQCHQTFELESADELTSETVCPECSGKGTMVAKEFQRIELDPALATRHLTSVVASGKHLLSVVNDVLDSSKLEAGMYNLDQRESPVQDLLESVRLSFLEMADQEKVRFVVEPWAPELTGYMDASRVSQILFNLVSNAIKFSDNKGTVTLRAEKENDVLRFICKDEGIGIAPEHHQLIFESFRQVEGGHTRRFGGTGLGLSIAQRLAKLHGGSIQVDSAEGQGSTFTVELPQPKTELSAVPGPNATAHSG